MKNTDDIIGNRTRELPACSAVPQPTAPPRGLFIRFNHYYHLSRNLNFHIFLVFSFVLIIIITYIGT